MLNVFHLFCVFSVYNIMNFIIYNVLVACVLNFFAIVFFFSFISTYRILLKTFRHTIINILMVWVIIHYTYNYIYIQENKSFDDWSSSVQKAVDEHKIYITIVIVISFLRMLNCSTCSTHARMKEEINLTKKDNSKQ